MAKTDLKVNFRVPELLRAELGAFAEEHNISLSEACRVCITTALGSDMNRAAAAETVYAFGATRARIVRQVLERTGEIMGEVIQDELSA